MSAASYFNLSSDLMFACTPAGVITDANPVWQKYLVDEATDVRGRPLEEFLSFESAQLVLKKISQAKPGNQNTFSLEFSAKDSGYKVFETRMQFVANEQLYYFAATAIATKWNDQERWNLALESSDAGFWDWDIVTGAVYFSNRYKEMLGYADHELEASFATWQSLLHPDDVEYALRVVDSFARIENQSSFRITVRMRTKTGEYRWVQTMGSSIKDESGKVIHAAGWHFDINEQKLAEERLRRSEERSRAILNALPDLLFIVDVHGKYVEIHTTAPDRLIRPAEELIGRNIAEFLPHELSEEFKRKLKKAHVDGTVEFVEYELEVALGLVYFEARIVCGGGEGNCLLIVRDVTAKKLAEQAAEAALKTIREQQVAMAASSRLASLGEMAGGIAHEINNPLTIIHANAARLRDLASEDRLNAEQVSIVTNKIESTAMRISRIIAGLRTISRDGAEDLLVKTRVASIVGDAISLCSEKLKHHQIDLQIPGVSELLQVECRAVQICQVLVNLLSNAEHAVESAGGVGGWIRIEVRDNSPYIDIRISDSGAGIPKNVREKVFDPFFTTKEVGKGMGLGLSVSASIMKSHGGQLFLDPESPQTCFVARLPRVQQS